MFVIENIYWERANIHFVFNRSLKGLNVYLIKYNEIIRFTCSGNELIINVTNCPKGGMLAKGKWKIIVRRKPIASYQEYNEDVEFFSKNTIISSSLLKELENHSRIFKYRKDSCAYLVTLEVNSSLNLYIHTDFMIQNRHWKKFYLFQETGTLRGKSTLLLCKFYLVFINVYYRFFHLFKWNRKKNLLFLTENEDTLTNNLKAVYESMQSDNCRTLVFCQNFFVKENRTFFKLSWNYLKEIFLISQSDVIFIDNYTPKLGHLKLSKKCRLVQLWHAGVGFKAIGYARFGKKGSPHPKCVCHRNYTDVIVDNEDLIDIYKEVFGLPSNKFHPIGIPRLDGYLNKNIMKKKINDLFQLNPRLKNKKIILFSPTYRGRGHKNAYYDYSKIDLKRIYEFCSKNNFLFIMKMHPFIHENISIPKKYQKIILDYSSLALNDLIYISDIMITDYSSCVYEFSLFNRPIIFYRFDKEIYEYLYATYSHYQFSKKQYEVTTFEGVMNSLEKLKNISIKNRFSDMQSDSTKSSCNQIKDIFLYNK